MVKTKVAVNYGVDAFVGGQAYGLCSVPETSPWMQLREGIEHAHAVEWMHPKHGDP